MTVSMSNGIAEGTIGFAYKPFSSGATGGLNFTAVTSTGLGIFTLRNVFSKVYLFPGGGSYSTNEGTMAAASIANYAGNVDTSIWSWVSIEFKIHPTNGYIRVYINSIGGLSTPIINVSTWAAGATIGAYRMTGCTFMMYNSLAYYIDDVCVNSKSVSFVSSSGTLSAGNTITGGTSGATATVTYVENMDSTYGTAGAGRITITGITGTFTDGESISNGSGWSATIQLAGGDFDGLDYNSSTVGETYLIGLSLSGDRSVMMTGSDGDQVNNYLLLNEQLADDTTFVQAVGVDTALDLYELDDITQNISVISAISINTRIKKAGEINYAIPAVDIGGTTVYPSTPINITTNLSYAKKHTVIDINADQNQPFSKQNINDLAVGIRFK
jgi:hypothetical protein